VKAAEILPPQCAVDIIEAGATLPPVTVRLADDMLEIDGLLAGETSRFPYVYLRDNCECKVCFHATSSSRLTSFRALDWEDKPARVEYVRMAVPDYRLGRKVGSEPIEPETECLRVDWKSGHESVFTLKWLRERCFSKGQQKQRAKNMDLFELIESSVLPDVTGPDGAAVRDSAAAIGKARESQCRTIPTFSFDEIRSSPQDLVGWSHALEKYGMAIVRTNNQTAVLKDFTELFGFREWCSYGEFFIVENKQAEEGAESNNLAYTGVPLQLHTDLPHYASPPQVQLLHCVSQTSCAGGWNTLADGFAVAEQIRQRYPEAFELLASVEVEYKDFHSEVLWDSGPGGETTEKSDVARLGSRREVDFFLRQRHPIISLENPGDYRNSRIARINFSDHHRDSVLNNLDADRVRDFYHACRIFDDLVNSEKNVVWSKSGPGDILCFDNRRMLHGRSGFEVRGGETRKLIGTYLRWDEIRSMARVKAAGLFPDRLL
jgi:gamma-butyrobetaine dioxygenase